MEIIPAIMPENFHHLRADVGIVADHVSVIQLDIMDGKFVPAKTWPYLRKVEEGAPTDVYFQAIQNGDEGLPLWEKVDFELDLMIGVNLTAQ